MRILDIGSGPSPKLGSTYLEVDIVHCDINSNELVEYQDMEKLTYPDNSFDIVICINALDHTKDALAAVLEMLRVAKYFVYINCALDQKTRHGKKHYWDAKADGRFINPTGEFDLYSLGFDIEFEDGRMIARKYA